MKVKPGSDKKTLLDLRQRAEAKVGQIFGSEAEFLARDPVALLHELKVHQIELEMQNEELRGAQEELTLLKDRYKELYDFAPAGYITLDEHYGIVEANLAAASLFGIDRLRMIGLSMERLVHGESWKVFRQFALGLLSGESAGRCEVRIAAGKAFKWLLIDGAPAIEGGGGARSIRMTLSDITERTDLEEKILALNRDLEKRIQEGIREIREKERLLLVQSRHAAMGEMIANIAHQWRQPLNALGLMIQTISLARQQDKLTPEYAEDIEKRVMEIINHMSQTIDDFRNYFRPGKEKTLFKVCKVVDWTMTLVKERFKESLIEIERIKKEEQTIKGYPNEFGQVILNILLNARDAFEGEFNPYNPERRITITIAGENGRSVIKIADNAGGIPADIIDKVFEPYFTTKGPDRGTGIGLYMAKSIIEKGMGGSLTVRNIDGGAEFRIEV